MKSPPELSPAARKRRLEKWAAESGVELGRLDAMQCGVVLAALRFLRFVGKVPALRQVVAYLLSHCGMGLSTPVIGAVVGTTDRAVRKGRAAAPKEFWKRLRQARRGHRPTKLKREQVGLVARFLAQNKRSSVAEVLAFIHHSFGVQLDRLTLRRFLKRYGLGCLREEAVEDTPFLSDAPSMEERSS
jgi:transposase